MKYLVSTIDDRPHSPLKERLPLSDRFTSSALFPFAVRSTEKLTGPSILFWGMFPGEADYDQPMDSHAQMPEVFWLGILTKITPTGCMSGIGNTPAEGKCHS